MNTTAVIHGQPDMRYVEIDGTTNQIPDETLEELLQNHESYFRFDVLYNDSNNECSFYESIANHPRLEEFVKADVDYMFRNAFGTRCTNPKVSEKFAEMMAAKIGEEAGLSADLVEEFLHFVNNRKSARSSAV